MVEWKKIKGYETHYEVSNDGRIRSLDRLDSYKSGRFRKGRELKLLTVEGYSHINLHKDGINGQMLVHRIVAQQFIENPDNKPCVNHKNGIRNDNRVENLEWCTQSENVKHGYRSLGRVSPQKGNYGNKHSAFGKGVLLSKPKKVKCVTLGIEFNSANEAARLLGVGQGHLSSVCRGERRHTNGLVFRYLE